MVDTADDIWDKETEGGGWGGVKGLGGGEKGGRHW